jgi:hypothetical protein
MNAQSTGVSVLRSRRSAVTAEEEVGLATSGKSGVSMRSLPGATSAEPAPPTITARGTPASAQPARSACRLSEKRSCGSPGRGPIALTATSWPLTSGATEAASVISPATTVRRSAGSMPVPSRVTAVTS